jgi:hypothetical protein
VAQVNAWARATRADATRLRNESQGLKFVLRGNLARSRQRLGEAQLAADTVRARRAIPHASPWSGLHWLLEDESLETILLPVD